MFLTWPPGLKSMQDRKYPLEKGSGTEIWLSKGWLWNVEAGLPGI